jgi:glycosyltransferase involved in cell wall biosynthesis
VHVLYIIDSVDRPGGAEQGLATMAPALARRGQRSDVAYLLDREGFQDDLAHAGIGVHPVLHSSRPARVRALRRLIDEVRPDIVHTTLFEADLAGRVAARLAGVPVVSSLVNVPYGPEHLGAEGLRSWKVRAAQAADLATSRLVTRFHAISDHVRSVMAARLRITASRIDVVPRGRDPESLGTRSAERRRRVRAGLELPVDVPVLLSVARHEYQKGLDVAVEAMAEVARVYPHAVYVVAGREGNLTATMKAIAVRHRLHGSVRLLGPRTDVADLLAAADVFVGPSRWEGLGSAAVEAMGARTPIVLSDVAALREAVGSDESALLVTPDDPAALAVGLIECLKDPAAATMRAEHARARFDERFTLDRVVEQMESFYQRAVTGAKRGPNAGT